MAMETPARIAIIGAGPIGLEAALYARYLGYDVDVYEQGRVADSVLRWGHVRMFTPFGENRSPLALAALKAQDPSWQPPGDDQRLTGREFAERYLLPLATSDLLADAISVQTEVLAIGRDGVTKSEQAHDELRGEHDFRLLLRETRADGHRGERYAAADVVIDTSGTYTEPNWLGACGLPAIGEATAREHVEYGLADVLGAQRGRYASRNVLLVGDGFSAATNLLALAELAGQAADTWITWVTRGGADEAVAVDSADDVSASRRERTIRQALSLAQNDANHITFLGETNVEAIDWHAGIERFSIRLAGKHAGDSEFDRVIANVGFHPNDAIYRELQVRVCPFTASSLTDFAASGRYQGTPSSIVQPEPDFYILGAKSYGRDGRFLISAGLSQIRDLFTIIGDRAELDLYATMAGLH